MTRKRTTGLIALEPETRTRKPETASSPFEYYSHPPGTAMAMAEPPPSELDPLAARSRGVNASRSEFQL